MEQLYLDLGEKSYYIHFEKDFNGLVAALESVNAPKKLLIVTDTNVDAIYGEEVLKILQDASFDVARFTFPAGEQHKTMQTILDICSACMDHKMDRKSMILVLGGGVVGDMAGFAASIFMRGIRYVQVPTTLLSQSDSSVGGKTGIDFADAKNILGAFHQPQLVYINVSTLKTLPEREFISGMGEVMKHGVIRDASFFTYLEENSEKIKALDPDTLVTMAKVNCGIKADVVQQDEFEGGLRAILNFGHTIGHAVESASDFQISHGECVGLGMCAASYIAKMRGLLQENDYDRIIDLLRLYNFRTQIEIEDPATILQLMQKDKKMEAGTLKFILPEKIGAVIQITDVTEPEILSAIASIRTGAHG